MKKLVPNSNDPRKSAIALVFIVFALIPAGLNWMRHGDEAVVTQATLYIGVFAILVFALGLMLLRAQTILSAIWLLSVSVVVAWMATLSPTATLIVIPLSIATVMALRPWWALSVIVGLGALVSAAVWLSGVWHGVELFIPVLLTLATGAITALAITIRSSASERQRLAMQLANADAKNAATAGNLAQIAAATSLVQVDKVLEATGELDANSESITAALEDVAVDLSAAIGQQVDVSVTDAEGVPLHVQNSIVRVARLRALQIADLISAKSCDQESNVHEDSSVEAPTIANTDKTYIAGAAQDIDHAESPATSYSVSIAFSHRHAMATLAMVDNADRHIDGSDIAHLVESGCQDVRAVGGATEFRTSPNGDTTFLVAIPTNPGLEHPRA